MVMNRTNVVATMIQAVSAPFIPVSPMFVSRIAALEQVIERKSGVEQREGARIDAECWGLINYRAVIGDDA